jgi:hypothetical protein
MASASLAPWATGASADLKVNKKDWLLGAKIKMNIYMSVVHYDIH